MTGPTHPTPTYPPKLAVPAGRVLDEADRILAAEIELHHTGIGEPHEYSRPPLPLLGTAEDCDCGHGDLERMFHLRPCPRLGPPPLPTLDRLATRPPVLRGEEEPTPGSAAVLRGAARESTGPADGGPGAGVSPDPSPSSGAPAALPGRGVGPGYIGAA